MKSTGISEALRRLLETKLDTIEKVELVMLLGSATAPPSLHDVAMRLQVGPDVLRRVVDDVARTGLVGILPVDLLELRADPAELSVIAEAAQVYNADRSRMMRLLSSIAIDRARSMPARSFADAFKIRRKKDDGHG